MRLVVLHVDGLRCAKVDYRIIVRLIPKNCLHCLKAALVFGRRTTYSVPGIPQFAAHQLKLLSGRCAESHAAKQPSTIKNARKEFTINDRDEFYTQTKRFEQELPKIFMLCLHTPWGSLRCGMTNSTR